MFYQAKSDNFKSGRENPTTAVDWVHFAGVEFLTLGTFNFRHFKTLPERSKESSYDLSAE